METKDRFSQTSLLYAERFRFDDIARLLLDTSAKPKVKDKHNWPPVVLAAIRGHGIIIGLLREDYE